MQLSLGLLSGHLHRRLQVLNSRQDHPSADWIQILFGLLCQSGSGFSLQVRVFHWQLGIVGVTYSCTLVPRYVGLLCSAKQKASPAINCQRTS